MGFNFEQSVENNLSKNMKYEDTVQGRKEYKKPGMEDVGSTGELRKESAGPSLVKSLLFVDVCLNVLL